MFCSNSKKKMALIATAFLYISMTQANAQEVNQGPIAFGHWAWSEEVTLSGKKFSGETVADSYREQMGRAIINDLGSVTFWLYDTYSYHNGNGSELINKYIPHWIENYYNETIDFDNIRDVSPNENMPSSLKALMKQRGCDVAVAYIIRNWGTSSAMSGVVINAYDKEKNNYFTYIYPFIGNRSFFEDFVGEPNIDDEQDLDVATTVDIENEMVLVDNFYITKEPIGVMCIGDAYSFLYKLNDTNPDFYYRLPMYADWDNARNKGVLTGDYPYAYGWTQAPIYIVKEKTKGNSEINEVDSDVSVSDDLEIDSESISFKSEIKGYWYNIYPDNVDRAAYEAILFAQKKAGTDFKEYTGKFEDDSGMFSKCIDLGNGYILGIMHYWPCRMPNNNYIGFAIARGENFKKNKDITNSLRAMSNNYDWHFLTTHSGSYAHMSRIYNVETEIYFKSKDAFMSYLSSEEKVSDELAEFLKIFK